MMLIRITFAMLATAVLCSCATPPKTLYNWGPFEPQIYQSFKNEAPESQIQILETHLKVIQDSHTKAPPGFYAHLGLLYEKTGQTDKFVAMMENEKTNFPESTSFMNRILTQPGKRNEK